MSICYVTAFLDLNRNEWTSYQRSLDHYFNSFQPLVDMFRKLQDDDNYHLIIFMDEKHVERLNNVIHGISKIIVVPINEEFLKNNIAIWKRIDKESEIMKSESYKTLISHRLDHPEHHNPKYTMINHAKIDFLVLAMEQTMCEYLCWVDFGYFGEQYRIPRNPLDINKLQKDKINYTLVHPIDDRDRNIIYTMKEAPYKVGGFFFFGNRDKLKEFQILYHNIHDWFHRQWLVDDDQHIVLQCYFNKPDLFAMHHLGWYHLALTHFQKD